jgi:putative membrane protein
MRLASKFYLVAASSMFALGLAGCGQNSDTASNALPATTTLAATTPASTTPSTSQTDANVKAAQTFINTAGQAGLLEIQTSKMALERSHNPDVKTFAQMMIDQHTQAAEGLKAAAAAAALAPPSETLDEAHVRLVSDLTENRPSDEFDADYMHMQVDAHAQAVQLFQDYAKAGEIAPVKAFADQTLPMLQQHKAKALEVTASIQGKTPHPS